MHVHEQLKGPPTLNLHLTIRAIQDLRIIVRLVRTPALLLYQFNHTIHHALHGHFRLNLPPSLSLAHYQLSIIHHHRAHPPPSFHPLSIQSLSLSSSATRRTRQQGRQASATQAATTAPHCNDARPQLSLPHHRPRRAVNLVALAQGRAIPPSTPTRLSTPKTRPS